MKEQSTPLVLLCLALLVGMTSCAEPIPWDEKDSSFRAYLEAEARVKQQLRSPSTAKFPGMMQKGDHVSRTRQYYTIYSWVDAQNAFGATIRTRWVAEVEQTSEDNWVIHSAVLL